MTLETYLTRLNSKHTNDVRAVFGSIAFTLGQAGISEHAIKPYLRTISDIAQRFDTPKHVLLLFDRAYEKALQEDSPVAQYIDRGHLHSVYANPLFTLAGKLDDVENPTLDDLSVLINQIFIGTNASTSPNNSH